MKKRSEKMKVVTVTNTQDIVSRPETLALLSDIRSLIEAARMRVSTTANVEMVLLYWHIGNRILKDILGKERADYGKQIVQTLSGKLTLEYGRGFTRTNLFNMIRCAEVFPDREIVHALSGQLSWTHFRENNLIISPQSMQRSQSSAIPLTAYETAPPSRQGTRMTRIGRIFTDLRVSASSALSAFHSTPSAFICVHLRLIFVSLSDRLRKIQFKLSTQSTTIPVTKYEKAAASRFRTRMTRIARIFTDYPCVSASSAQSAFYCLPSAFYCIHLRLIFNRKTQEALGR
ncbi:MAG: DUF1016 N-terminal domain-containing protein [Candidatus Methanoperedens sp.]